MRLLGRFLLCIVFIQGVLQIKKELGMLQSSAQAGSTGAVSSNNVVDQCPFLLDFLNRFYTSRIGIRLLISQHIALHHPRPGYIGNVAINLSPCVAIQEAIADATRICEREYNVAPTVELTGDASKTFKFIPSHLHHIAFELLKNSMRGERRHFACHLRSLMQLQVALYAHKPCVLHACNGAFVASCDRASRRSWL